MKQKFFELSLEKQQAIINAALEVFAMNDYKHAITDDIAAKAGISKGLLFYYFHNKAELYNYLFLYAKELLTKEIVNQDYYEMDDFFELLKYAAVLKYQMFKKNPYLYLFSVKVIKYSYLDEAKEIQKIITEYSQTVFKDYFMHINFQKFREEINPKDIMDILLWTGEGYMYELQLKGQTLDIDDIMRQFEKWIAIFKKIAYKEEFQ